MVKNNIKPYLVQGIVVMSLTVFCLLGYLLTISTKVVEEQINSNNVFVSKEILTDNVEAVIKEEILIERPYQQENVKIGKTFYDYKAEKEEQELSINFYENTYIQNTGVDYVSENVFNIHSILDGKIISITTDDIVGTTIKIEHKNKMISTYQSIKDVVVEENAEVVQGQVLGTSGENSYNKELGNHLHFELYYKNKLVDPEEYFGKPVGE